MAKPIIKNARANKFYNQANPFNPRTYNLVGHKVNQSVTFSLHIYFTTLIEIRAHISNYS